MMRRLFVVLLIAFLCSEAGLNAQVVAVKTNALYLATSTFNAGVEVALGDRFSVDLEGGCNPWNLDSGKNMKARHYLVSPEIRYWFCESFNGHFIGVNANYTLFNVGGVDGNNFEIRLRKEYSYGWNTDDPVKIQYVKTVSGVGHVYEKVFANLAELFSTKDVILELRTE